MAKFPLSGFDSSFGDVRLSSFVDLARNINYTQSSTFTKVAEPLVQRGMYCYLHTSSLGMVIDFGVEIILHQNLCISIIFRQPLPRFNCLILKNLLNCLGARNKSCAERKRTHILSIRVSKDIHFLFFPLQISRIEETNCTSGVKPGLILNAQMNLVRERKSPCSARGCPLHCLRPHPKVLYPFSFG